MPADKPQILSIRKIHDRRGNLSVMTCPEVVPFEIARTYWIHDIVTGERRDGHAFRKAEECIVAVSGSFDVVTEGLWGRETYSLNRPDCGLYVPPLTWREICNTSSNAVALVVTSTPYDAEDYLRDYALYRRLISMNNV